MYVSCIFPLCMLHFGLPQKSTVRPLLVSCLEHETARKCIKTFTGCVLSQVGGRLVYSTCSLNPIEDEAVVAEVIRRTGGAMQLVDVSKQIPKLKRIAGLRTWKVFDPNR